MRKEYGSVLRRSFARNMRARLPQFDPFKIDSDYVLPGERIFRWLPEDELHCFAERARPAGIASPERSEFGEEEFTCRMSDLWATGDVWWQVTDFDPIDPESQLQYILAGAKPISAEEAQAAVAPKVEDAIEKLVDHGVPYLEEYVRSQREGA
jgi:hypothetical protein